ncbi:phosphatase PAP2 family protein [Paraflavitalea soli]|uniref:Phosphatase PAP2 family protein n=1 Tax=Paraflavitalea soli TaxID=2315862 RepID=A0A3B7MHJ8_9BACT|nr:phosphatase PAP2 family protein [Paraflavitalea soli]AXY72556.1 phosphatase PAP2 family protein [Paraflavitalea soli]
MTLILMARTIACTLTSFLLLYSPVTMAQKLPVLEPPGAAYQSIAVLSSKPNEGRKELDTIRYPWAEYSKGALGNALWRTVYLLPADEAQLPGLIQFPASSSDQTRAELDYLLKLQNSRTQQEIDRANYIANIGSWPNILNPTDPDYQANREQLYYILSTATGKQYDYSQYPATTTLLLNCIQDIRVTEFRLKQVFKRPRPYHVEPRLQPLTRISSPSFPSGHSLWSYTEAYIFAELFPQKRQDFIKVAAEVRWSRELLGIHYPSDNEASRVIGWHLLKSWYKNPRFVADLKKAQMEWSSK